MQFSQVDILDDGQSNFAKILKLGWPVTLSMLFHTSYSVIDMLWVARLGQDAVAAITLTGIVMWAMFAVTQVFAAGVHSLVARAHGAGHIGRANVVLKEGLWTGVLTGVVFSIVVATWPREILVFLRAEPGVIAIGTDYMRIMAFNYAGLIALFTINAAFRGTGDMITPLILSALSCAANIVLDPILIFGVGIFPEMGLAGAAIASVISIYLSLVIALGVVGRRTPGAMRVLMCAPDMSVIRDLFSVGIPTGLHYALLSVIQTAAMWMIAKFGTAEVAVAGIAGRIMQVSMLPCMGIGMATATMVGQFLGAGRAEDAEEAVATAIRATFVSTAVICISYAVAPAMLLRPFTDSVLMIDMGTGYLRLAAIGMMFITTTITLTRVFQGAGDTVWPTVVVAIRCVIFGIIAPMLGWWAGWGAIGIWTAMVLSAAPQTLLIMWVYRLGTWKKKRLRSVEDPSELPA
jgi:putative MATE family efflux protein